MCGLEIKVRNLSELLGGGIRTEFTHGRRQTVTGEEGARESVRPKAGLRLPLIFSESDTAFISDNGRHTVRTFADIVPSTRAPRRA